MDGMSKLPIASQSQRKLPFPFSSHVIFRKPRPWEGWGSRVGEQGGGGGGVFIMIKKKVKKKRADYCRYDFVLEKLYCDFEECWNLFKGIMR